MFEMIFVLLCCAYVLIAFYLVWPPWTGTLWEILGCVMLAPLLVLQIGVFVHWGYALGRLFKSLVGKCIRFLKRTDVKANQIDNDVKEDEGNAL